MTKKIGCKQILDVGNASSRCGVCSEAIQKGMGMPEFKKLKTLAKKTGVKLSDLSAEHVKKLKKMLKDGKSPTEIMEEYIPIISEKYGMKMSGKGYQCGTGFSSVVGREFVGALNNMKGKEEKVEGKGNCEGKHGMGVRTSGSGVRTSGSKCKGSGVRTSGSTTKGVGVRTSGGALEVQIDMKDDKIKAEPKKSGKKSSAWIEWVKKYRSEHPGMSYRTAMSEAKASYRKK